MRAVGEVRRRDRDERMLPTENHVKVAESLALERQTNQFLASRLNRLPTHGRGSFRRLGALTQATLASKPRSSSEARSINLR
ncbi:hypothetical protein THAOC_02682 [Thalassiosira oceanica]|uniref:Uncharacterized protein n=1 Tax=Thalassiosira oceanica TaxID=159749 RepID=K0TEQ6_THAOC|nr:hypothetical protein THAOC_02682 [Thalassiosira oceanica]|eukprot:EJK75589.1 hypothetical protein THAOC_02682 [Thalassiosira oceanica]